MRNNKFMSLALYVLLAAVLDVDIPAAGAASAGADDIDRGRYLVMIAGCNDCHTPNYLLSDGKTPEAEWLTGSSFGWHGPWGTTYAPNLRLLLDTLGEDEWVQKATQLKARPPMPWYSLNLLKDEDLRAIYRYVRHIGPAGEPAPQYLPPGQEPPPPFASFPSPPPG